MIITAVPRDEVAGIFKTNEMGVPSITFPALSFLKAKK